MRRHCNVLVGPPCSFYPGPCFQTDDIAADDRLTTKLAVEALMEVCCFCLLLLSRSVVGSYLIMLRVVVQVASVDDSGKNIEIAVMRPG